MALFPGWLDTLVIAMVALLPGGNLSLAVTSPGRERAVLHGRAIILLLRDTRLRVRLDELSCWLSCSRCTACSWPTASGSAG